MVLNISHAVCSIKNCIIYAVVLPGSSRSVWTFLTPCRASLSLQSWKGRQKPLQLWAALSCAEGAAALHHHDCPQQSLSFTANTLPFIGCVCSVCVSVSKQDYAKPTWPIVIKGGGGTEQEWRRNPLHYESDTIEGFSSGIISLVSQEVLHGPVWKVIFLITFWKYIRTYKMVLIVDLHIKQECIGPGGVSISFFMTNGAGASTQASGRYGVTAHRLATATNDSDDNNAAFINK